MLKEVKNHTRNNTDYGYDNHPGQVPQISGRARNIQITQIVGLSTPIVNQTNHTGQQNVNP